MTLQEKGYEIIVNMAAVIAVAVYLLKMLEQSAIIGLLFACSIACVIAQYVCSSAIRKRIKIVDMLMFVSMIFSIIFSEMVADFEYIKPAIIVICCVLCIDQGRYIQVSYKSKRRILMMIELATVMTNIMYYVVGLRYVTFGNTNAVALNFGNPNETAMWIGILIVILGNAVAEEKRTMHRFFLYICIASLCPILVATESRNCMIAIAFYFIGGLIQRRIKAKCYPAWVLWMITVAPALVYLFYIYILLPHIDVFSKALAFIVSEGKTLTSRSIIWSDAQSNFWQCFLIGKYHKYYSEQLHNALLTLYARFGMLFVIIVCNKFYKAIKNADTGLIQLAMATVWMMGCFETGIFVGIGGMYLLVLLIPIFGGEQNLFE